MGFVVLLVLLPLLSFAQTESDFEVRLTEDYKGVIITKYNGIMTDVVIPPTIQGFPVRQIGEASFSRSDRRLTSIVIPEGVTRIGESAFAGSALMSITIPEGVEIIDQRAFFYCPQFTTVNLPSTIKSIGILAFGVCKNITTINIPDTVVSIKFGTWGNGSQDLFGDGYENDSAAGRGGEKLSLQSQAVLRTRGYKGRFYQ
jgi:hypothetical protein